MAFRGPRRPSSETLPMDRLQRASPFAGGPGGKASWRVSGQSPDATRFERLPHSAWSPLVDARGRRREEA
jgi:hypothetical protein